MTDRDFYDKIGMIEKSIRDAGYDPYSQLTGFIRTHDDRYITRNGNARTMIRELDWSMLKQYVKHMKQ